MAKQILLPEQLFAEGTEAEQSGNYRTAIKKYLEFTAHTNAEPNVLLAVGKLYEKVKDDFKASECYQHVVALKAAAPAVAVRDAYLRLIALENRFLRHEVAVEYCDLALESAPDDMELLLAKLNALYELTLSSTASAATPERKAQFEQTAEFALRLEPENYLANCFFGRAKTLAGDHYDQALMAFDKARQIDAGRPFASYLEGLLHIRRRDHDLACVAFDKAAACATDLTIVAEARRYADQFRADAKNDSRRRRFWHTSLEEQLAVLSKYGIKLNSDFTLERVFAVRQNRVEYEEKEPFLRALLSLGYNDLAANVRTFNFKVAYEEIAMHCRDIAEGDFDLEEVQDYFYGDDDGKAAAWISFKLAGKKYKWKLKCSGSFFDLNVLYKLADLLRKTHSSKRFVVVSQPGSISVLCLTEAQTEALAAHTGLDLEYL